MRIILSLLWLLALSGASSNVLAHAGEDHGDAPHPAPSQIAPRFEVRSESFELVGVLHGNELLLFLDRADSNAPIAAAEIEIESSGFKAKAEATGQGEFHLPAGALGKPGKHDLTISIATDDDSDLLSVRFEHVAAEVPALAPTANGGTRTLAYGLAALLLAALVVWRIRQRSPA